MNHTATDRLTCTAVAMLGSGNARSVAAFLYERGLAHDQSPRTIGQSLKRNAEAGYVIRHGKTAAANHTLASA